MKTDKLMLIIVIVLIAGAILYLLFFNKQNKPTDNSCVEEQKKLADHTPCTSCSGKVFNGEIINGVCKEIPIPSIDSERFECPLVMKDTPNRTVVCYRDLTGHNTVTRHYFIYYTNSLGDYVNGTEFTKEKAQVFLNTFPIGYAVGDVTQKYS